MNTTFDVMQRMITLRKTQPALHLYALVDGVQYAEQQGQPLRQGKGLFPLFAGTFDTALAFAGPWLIDIEQVDSALVAELSRLEREIPAVTWLIAIQNLVDLARRLQLELNIRLPDGRSALLRFWDPRVLAMLAPALDAEQRRSFFGGIHEWHLLREGRRVWIRGEHANVK
jgi:hypothetical protein